MKILFVCTGNTCRSPMAETLLKAKVCEAGKTDKFSVFSAGIAAEEGASATDNAKQAMWRRNLSLADHRAHLLTAMDIASADLVLTMTLHHKVAISQTITAVDKVYTLAEYSGSLQEISDPFGGDINAYCACAAVLTVQIESLWQKIKE